MLLAMIALEVLFYRAGRINPLFAIATNGYFDLDLVVQSGSLLAEVKLQAGLVFPRVASVHRGRFVELAHIGSTR